MIRRLALLICLTLRLARADEAPDRFTLAGIAEFTAAYQAWDGQRFAAAAGLFQRAISNAPASSTNHYWLGAAEFHRMLQLRSLPATPASTQAADAAREAALAALTTAVGIEAQHAESHALLGTLYGMKIDGNALRAMRYGPRVAKERRKAMESGAENARVRYLVGMCQFHTARKSAAYREALSSLLTAEKLFATEANRTPGPLEPRWGYASCLTFIGRSYEALGQGAEAAAYFRKALARHPADHLAKEGLARVTAKE